MYNVVHWIDLQQASLGHYGAFIFSFSHITDHIRTLITSHGTDIWWNADKEKLLPKEIAVKVSILISSFSRLSTEWGIEVLSYAGCQIAFTHADLCTHVTVYKYGPVVWLLLSSNDFHWLQTNNGCLSNEISWKTILYFNLWCYSWLEFPMEIPRSINHGIPSW